MFVCWRLLPGHASQLVCLSAGVSRNTFCRRRMRPSSCAPSETSCWQRGTCHACFFSESGPATCCSAVAMAKAGNKVFSQVARRIVVEASGQFDKRLPWRSVGVRHATVKLGSLAITEQDVGMNGTFNDVCVCVWCRSSRRESMVVLEYTRRSSADIDSRIRSFADWELCY